MKKILIIVPDGGMLFESAGIADILMQANRLHPEGAASPCYQVQLATTQPHQVIHGQSGLNLLADHRLHEIDPREPLDTIIITGRGQNAQEGIAVVDWLRLAAPHARRIASICGGAMLLAQSGLLNGKRATTHWKLLETLQMEYPQVRVEGGPLYIQDEHIWTSGGVSSGFDLTLALVEEDYGFSLARDIARQRLEQTNDTLERVAQQTGFSSSINLRRLFEKQLHLTPGEYRQRFHCRKMA